MSITVKEAMESYGLGCCKLLGGAGGIGHIISVTGSMEIPDIRGWLRKNQLLITTGYALKEDPKGLLQLIQDLHDEDCSGLAIKTRFIGHIPQKAINLANKLKLPLLEIPEQIPFEELTRQLRRALNDEYSRLLDISQRIHQTFLDQELMGGGFENLAKTLCQFIQGSICITNTDLSTIASAKYSDDESNLSLQDFKQIIQDHDKDFIEFEKARELENTFTYPTLHKNRKLYLFVRKIIFRNDIKGFIFIMTQRPTDELGIIAINHAAIIGALEFSKLYAIQDQNRVIENQLFTDILSDNSNSEENLIYRSNYLHWPKPPLNLCVFDIKNFAALVANYSEIELQSLKIKIRNLLNDNLGKYDPSIVIINMNDSFYCLFSAKEIQTDIQSILRKITGKIKKDFQISAMVGVECDVQKYSDIARAYQDVRDAVTICRCNKSFGNICFIKDCKLEQMVLHLKQEPQLSKYVDETMVKLAEYDKKNKSEFLSTLSVFLDNMGNRSKTANILFIHRNTLAYRLKRIERILSCNLSDSNTLFACNLALRLYLYRSGQQ